VVAPTYFDATHEVISISLAAGSEEPRGVLALVAHSVMRSRTRVKLIQIIRARRLPGHDGIWPILILGSATDAELSSALHE
jgi:hypothetical protein